MSYNSDAIDEKYRIVFYDLFSGFLNHLDLFRDFKCEIVNVKKH